MFRWFLVIVPLLAGCVHRTPDPTRADYERAVKEYIGKDVNELYTFMGEPRTRTMMPGGDVLYEWLLNGPNHWGDYCLVRFTADQLNNVRTAFLVGNDCGD